MYPSTLARGKSPRNPFAIVTAGFKCPPEIPADTYNPMDRPAPQAKEIINRTRSLNLGSSIVVAMEHVPKNTKIKVPTNSAR
ncbi:hypothetical protein AX774_g2274 [Zancudomyces culisetae]|uniref:Uncharacterized protein n=1 Tax=Zancudomyces culisetae TaxID=1213189 RepID=A0A1R1PTB8_ZANCU|nr:hypothetical protein AX774_g2274 [Zancudomyces culisetae]|eukprot:OMH84210.1 hypothetical protein AX774_g2274 [Zancudomyces culisetae]